MLRLDWLSREVLSDADEMTPSRPRDYLIKYPNHCLLNEQANGLAELLKVEDVETHVCSIILRIRAKFKLLNAIQEKQALLYDFFTI